MGLLILNWRENQACVLLGKNKFKFHVGGFQEPYATSQEISLKAKGAMPLLIKVE